MSDSQVDLVLHASGLNRGSKMYRSYVCTYVDSKDEKELVKLKVFNPPQNIMKEAWGTGKDAGYFTLTDLGKEIAITIKKSVTAKNSKLIKGRNEN